MRTLEEIKTAITTYWMNDSAVANKYGFPVGANYSSYFSLVSIENVIFYVVAAAIYAHERLFAVYQDEVVAKVADLKPHSTRWYAGKIKQFRENTLLATDSDLYEDGDLTAEEIAELQIVKHAVAVEDQQSSLLIIKVAREEGGERVPLTSEQTQQLHAYIREVKDAGVRYSLVNEDGDKYNCVIEIFFDPLKLSSDVEVAVREAINSYLLNLPFNGEYTNMALIDSIQQVPGVKIAHLALATSSPASVEVFSEIQVRRVPDAGYFKPNVIDITMTPYV